MVSCWISISRGGWKTHGCFLRLLDSIIPCVHDRRPSAKRARCPRFDAKGLFHPERGCLLLFNWVSRGKGPVLHHGMSSEPGWDLWDHPTCPRVSVRTGLLSSSLHLHQSGNDLLMTFFRPKSCPKKDAHVVVSPQMCPLMGSKATDRAVF